MSQDLTHHTEAELIALQAEIEKELVRKATQKKADAKKALEITAKEYGFTLQELLSGKGTVAKSASVAKYANPANPSQTWTGKGRQPAWFKDALAAGKSADDLAL